MDENFDKETGLLLFCGNCEAPVKRVNNEWVCTKCFPFRENKVFWEKASRAFARYLNGVDTQFGVRIRLNELYFEYFGKVMTEEVIKALYKELDEEYQ